MNIETIKATLKPHHTAWTKGYISRINGEYFTAYKGRFGEGWRIFTPSWESTRFHKVTYYVA